MPDMQIILTNELSKIAAQTSLSLEGLVSSMRNSGMSNEAIKQTLVNDLTSGGRLFGNFRNQIKNTVKNGVEMSGNNGSMGTFENAGVGVTFINDTGIGNTHTLSVPSENATI